MGNFFKPLRRKIGILTIGLALMFAAGWLRSRSVSDLILFPTANSLHLWISDQCGIAWTVETQTDQEHKDLTFNLHVPFVVSPTFFQSHLDEWRLKFSFCGLKYFTGPAIEQFTHTPIEQINQARFIPYWSIVIPLALLSVWLLLSKSRAKESPVSKTEKT